MMKGLEEAKNKNIKNAKKISFIKNSKQMNRIYEK